MQTTPPCPAPTCWWQTQASGLLLHLQLQLGIFGVLLVFFFFFFCLFVFPQLCCLLRFQNSPKTCLWESFLLGGSFTSFIPSPGWVTILNSVVSLFVFYILSYLLSKRVGCLSECLVSSSSFQKLFCGSFSAIKWSIDKFVVEKVVPTLFLHHLGTAPDIFGFSIKVVLASYNEFWRNIFFVHFWNGLRRTGVNSS